MSGCVPQNEGNGPITVSSMIDAEGAILGNMLILILEDNGFDTINQLELGTPDILRKALINDQVDLIIDYTGSGQFYFETSDPAVYSDAKEGYEEIKKLDLENNNIYWLSPSKANNTEMIAVKREFALQNGLKTMEDFANFVNDKNEVKLICSSSFATNKVGLIGYEESYGFKLADDQLVILSSGNTSQMLKALYEGTDNVNFSLVYGTDGTLEQMDLIVLEDPLEIPPVYLPTPVIRGELVEKYPQLEEMFIEAFNLLNLEILQQLNSKVAFEGLDPKEVAKEFLIQNGLLE
jgi:osmoprotectant transport system substrate-binding protein